MKIFFLSLVLTISGLETMAQQQYFVFIQETSGQPFYVRIKEESHSSSATGHIILSQLKDSVYNFFIGFPRGRYGEQLFTVAINRKDHGYELRNTGSGRYQMFDLQAQKLMNPVSTAHESDQTIRKTDTYSELMAGVVDDSAVLYTSAQDTMSVDSNAVVVKSGVDSVVNPGQKNITAIAAPDSAKKAAKKPGSNSPGPKPGGNAAKKSDSTPPVPDSAKKPAKQADSTSSVSRSANDVAEKPDSTHSVPDSAKKPAKKTDSTSSVPSSADNVAQKIDSLPSAPDSANGVVQSSQNKLNSSPSPNRDSRDIIRLSTENIQEGKLMIYVDRTGAVNDTIRIIIPRQL